MQRRAALLALPVLLGACTPTPPPAPPPQPAPPLPIAASPPPAAAVAPPAPVAADTEHCQCPPEPAPGEPDDDGDDIDDIDDEPQTTRLRRSRARKQLPPALASRLREDLPEHRAACDVILSGPCTHRGDFDGDTLPDHAILVRAANNAAGIAILWGKGSADLLGGGRHQCWTTTEVADLDGSSSADPCLEPIDTDLNWISHWALLTHERTADAVLLGRAPSTRNHGHPAPGALGDALLLDGGDAAAALYRTSSGWTLMDLGY